MTLADTRLIAKKEVMKIIAYLVNDYYVFTSYKELSSHIHDVVHYTMSELEENHLFTIIKGEVYWDQLIFVSECGEEIPIKYESEEDIYYSTRAETG